MIMHKVWHTKAGLKVGLVFYVCATTACVCAQKTGTPMQPEVAREMRDASSSADRGDGQHALIVVEAIIQRHPDFVPALKLDGMLLEAKGDETQAAAVYRRALKLAPHDDDLLLKVGIADLLQGSSDDAVRLLNQRLQRLPRDEEGLYYMAQAYHLAGNNDAALKAIRLANAAHPKSVAIWQKYGELLCSSGNYGESLDWLKKVQAADPTLDRIDLDLAIASFDNLDMSAAAVYATSAVKAQPRSLEANSLLAAADVKLENWQDAASILDHILTADPDDASSLLELGHCQLELKQYQASVDTLQHALRIDPALVIAHFYLSRDYNGLGQADEATHEAALHRQMMQEIAFTLPKAEVAHEAALSAQAKQLLTAHREADAVQMYRDNPSSPLVSKGSPYVSVAAAYLVMDDIVDAQRLLEQAVALDSRTRGAHTYLGILALQHNDLSRAEQQFRAELAIDANHPLAMAELGEVRYRQEKWGEAAELFVRSKTALPELLYMLCDSYFHLGKTSDANLTAESIAALSHDRMDILSSLYDLLTRNGQAALAQRLVPGNGK